MRSFRWALRLGVGLAGMLAGGIWSGCRVPLYGAVAMYMPDIPDHDPTVAIQDFSYSPASPVQAGTSIEFRVTTNKPTDAGYVTVNVGGPGNLFFQLNDEGYAPDAQAEDGIWTGEWTVPIQSPAGMYTVSALLNWWDGFSRLELAGPPLTIILPEDE